MEFNSFGPAVGRLGSDSSMGGNLRQSRSRGAEPPPLAPLTLTTASQHPLDYDVSHTNLSTRPDINNILAIRPQHSAQLRVLKQVSK